MQNKLIMQLALPQNVKGINLNYSLQNKYRNKIKSTIATVTFSLIVFLTFGIGGIIFFNAENSLNKDFEFKIHQEKQKIANLNNNIYQLSRANSKQIVNFIAKEKFNKILKLLKNFPATGGIENITIFYDNQLKLKINGRYEDNLFGKFEDFLKKQKLTLEIDNLQNNNNEIVFSIIVAGF